MGIFNNPFLNFIKAKSSKMSVKFVITLPQTWQKGIHYCSCYCYLQFLIYIQKYMYLCSSFVVKLSLDPHIYARMKFTTPSSPPQQGHMLVIRIHKPISFCSYAQVLTSTHMLVFLLNLKKIIVHSYFSYLIKGHSLYLIWIYPHLLRKTQSSLS